MRSRLVQWGKGILVHPATKASEDILFLSLKTFHDHHSKVNLIPEGSFHKIMGLLKKQQKNPHKVEGGYY